MKKNYYKLNLVGSYFMQSDKNNNFTYRPFIKRESESLNSIFFKKISKYVYEEQLTKKRIIIYNGRVIYPKKIEIDINNFVLSNIEEVIDNFNDLKNNDLLLDYNKILNEFLEDSHYIKDNSKNDMKYSLKYNKK